jgi:hypothetical protein
MNSSMRLSSKLDTWLVALMIIAAGLIVALWTLGMLTARPAPDTAGYFASLSTDMWGTTRHPLYGMAAHLLGAGPDRPGAVGQVQIALLVVAAFTLYFGAQAGGIGRCGAFFLALAGLLSQSALLQVGLLIPEAPGISMLMMAFAGTLAASRGRTAFWLCILPVALATGAAYLLRPSFLPAIFVIPLLWLLFALRNRTPRTVTSALLLLLAVATPFIVQSAIRWRAIGDFNVVSFGGYQMSPMAGFMLTPDLVARLPETVRPTAQTILKAREAAEIAGTVARTPENSSGVRSFVSAALGYFDIYARSYDPLLGEIAKLRQPDESWIAFDRRLRNFSIATIVAAPGQWMAWVGGAGARVAGRIITNLPMLLALGVLLLAGVFAVIRRSGFAAAGQDIAAVSAVALAWLASTGSLIVLVTFPATRYIETAGMLMVAIPAMLTAAIVCGLRTPIENAATSGNA